MRHRSERRDRRRAGDLNLEASRGADVAGRGRGNVVSWARNRTPPVGAVDDERVEPARPSAETLKWKSSSPVRPISARPEKLSCNSSDSVFGRALLAHLVAQIAVAALGDGLAPPKRVVELGAERIGGVGRGADAEQREVLQRPPEHVERRLPRRAVPRDQRALVQHVADPARLRRVHLPAAVLPSRPRCRPSQAPSPEPGALTIQRWPSAGEPAAPSDRGRAPRAAPACRAAQRLVVGSSAAPACCKQGSESSGCWSWVLVQSVRGGSEQLQISPLVPAKAGPEPRFHVSENWPSISAFAGMSGGGASRNNSA